MVSGMPKLNLIFFDAYAAFASFSLIAITLRLKNPFAMSCENARFPRIPPLKAFFMSGAALVSGKRDGGSKSLFYLCPFRRIAIANGAIFSAFCF